MITQYPLNKINNFYYLFIIFDNYNSLTISLIQLSKEIINNYCLLSGTLMCVNLYFLKQRKKLFLFMYEK
jgi:hypothetical protein